MKNSKNDIILIVISIIASIALAFFIPLSNEIKYLSLLPNLLGILLSGILASLAIIFGLLSSRDLLQLKANFQNKERDVFLEFIKNTKLDAKIIFFSFVLSNVVYVIYDTELSPSFIDVQKRIFFALGLVILIFSLSSTYDVITSLFFLNELRYELANEKQE
ncbi:MAG: hypothetical protein NHB15_11320 [Methanosarcina barkeri]|nr:hypothetical protein [Methanosarcina sp. ERenArc_MAG2]